jgi:hypothetical protein
MTPHVSVARSAIVTLFLTLAAHASLTVTALTGRVVAADAPAAGVTVTISSAALQQPRTTTTNATGMYWFDALPPGTYEVTFSRAGLTSLARPALVELGRVARADARLEPSEEDESVTSTANPIQVAQTTAITTHFDDAELERLPLQDDRVSAARLAPGGSRNRVSFDEAPFVRRVFVGREAVEQLTVFRGALPVEIGAAGATVARTRSGGEEFSLALRHTYDHGRGHVFESASGGRIVPQRLWFFASGWGGEHDGVSVKFTGQPAAAHNLVAAYLHADGLSVPSLHYTGVLNERLTVEAIAGRDANGVARVSYWTGNHVLRAGVSEDEGATAIFVTDRWSYGALTLDAGLRRDDEQTAPRVGLTYDVARNGRHAVAASFGDYAGRMRMLTAGYTGAVGSTGIARIDLLRRERDGHSVHEAQLEARYSLFGRLYTGGSLTWSEGNRGERGNAWLGGTLPVGEHELGATLLERYERQTWATDLAVRYRVPFSRFALTAAADVLNAFGVGGIEPRHWRVWLRVRI